MFSKLVALALFASVVVAQRAILGGGLITSRGLGLVRADGLGGVGTGITLSNIGTLGYTHHAFLDGLGLHYGRADKYDNHHGPVTAAIETYRSNHVVHVPTSHEEIVPSTLIIEPNILPVNIQFKSQSSPVNVDQVHIPGRPGIVKETNSEEEADILRHTVLKPVIQEVRETIVPFRKITQEILPVQEQVHSLVAHGQRKQVLKGIEEYAVAAPHSYGYSKVIEEPIVSDYAVAPAGLITTGINRLAGPLYAKELIKARARAARA